MRRRNLYLWETTSTALSYLLCRRASLTIRLILLDLATLFD